MAQAFAVFVTRGRRAFRVRTISIIFIAVSSLVAIASPAQQNLVRQQVRFQILCPGVIRLEYSPHRKFVDAPSVTVLNRPWGPVELRDHATEGWLEISTNKMRMRYRLSSGAFTAANLRISWSDYDGEHHGEPGDKDDKNLGGVPGDTALRVVAGNEPGPLSRNGHFFLDDSRTAIWNSARDWVEPRPETNGQDGYFLVYGHDYKALLHDLAQLLGPIRMFPRGTWYSSRSGYSFDEWERIIRRFREEHVPLDMVTLDWDSTAKAILRGTRLGLRTDAGSPCLFQARQDRGGQSCRQPALGSLDWGELQQLRADSTAMVLPPDIREISHDVASKRYASLHGGLGSAKWRSES